jgi:hypothetical protein
VDSANKIFNSLPAKYGSIPISLESFEMDVLISCSTFSSLTPIFNLFLIAPTCLESSFLLCTFRRMSEVISRISNRILSNSSSVLIFRHLFNTGGINPPLRACSVSTIDTTHSTIGGARGTTQGSCLPGTWRSICVPVERSMVL